ncbi:MAG: hypothetical protein R2873_13130 [Caldilineaceae bacterium]
MNNDADVYPAVAYDAIGQRYLAVWMTARNAGSSSDGFDIYGVYLNENGQSTSSQFRIQMTTVSRSTGYRWWW